MSSLKLGHLVVIGILSALGIVTPVVKNSGEGYKLRYAKIFCQICQHTLSTPLRNELICPKNVGAWVAMNFN